MNEYQIMNDYLSNRYIINNNNNNNANKIHLYYYYLLVSLINHV